MNAAYGTVAPSQAFSFTDRVEPLANGLDKQPMLSVVTPAYNEARNLPVLYERLVQVLDRQALDWEWIVVGDHSGDDTVVAVASIAQRDSRVHAIRLARNSGSHTAITCGMDHAGGDCAAVLAADLQDPPEILPALLDQWRAGAQVVLVVGGVQMLMMGVLGEYLWRALDEARRRPRYIVEAQTARPSAETR
jgi:glycosyltransferase involved in cell wall biosynthesis